MNVHFTEADGTVRDWDGFKPDRMMSAEAETIEKLTGLTFVEWGQALLNGSAVAGRALVFVLKKRSGEVVRWRDLDFPVGDLSVELDEDEKAKVREALETRDDLDEEDREKILAALGPAEDTDPDDLSASSGNDPATPSASASD